MGNITKRERFENVASNRVQRILDTLQLLQNCSNKNNYEYTEKRCREDVFRNIFCSKSSQTGIR